ncbi:serine hydrolase [Longispora fulva]|uniref:Beta-lactamase class A n=1 Tax=Longispora fulva TaxID=619741 RepID=A0A8J7GPY7_9ACTN|nr:serine hydrolase [Longispora fulva]MBG6141277.1 beta-lactamase class A [Longispora fulva]GIG62726.1 serine hydrolase [Longispora fulva]
MLSILVAPIASGTASSVLGRVACERNADVPHSAASTMKAAVLAALYRSGLDLDAPVPVRNGFPSALDGEPFDSTPGYDSDPEVWARLGGEATLRWLGYRMVVRSSNFATNLVLAHVGLDAVADVWRAAGARRSVTGRGIEDYRANVAGIANLVTARDLAALMSALEPEVLDVLAANEHRVDLAAGLPAGTRIAFKNGWIDGCRHSAGIVYPADAPPYVIAVCYTGPLAAGTATGDPAARLLARISAAVWTRRHALPT